MADIDVRTIDDDRDEVVDAAFARTVNAAFGGEPEVFEHEVKVSLRSPGRRLAAFDGDAMVGTAGAFTLGMTVPGGGRVPAGGVSAVSVLPTHRRRGILRRMMAFQLDDIAVRGEPIAILNASESGIYRRFGYGIASFHQTVQLDTRRAVFADPHGDDLPVQFFTPTNATESAEVVQRVYDRWAPTRPGALTWNDAWVRQLIGRGETWLGGGPVFVAAVEPGPTRGGGYAIWTVSRRGEPGEWRLKARHLVADDPVVEARLWRFLLEVDLVGSVEVHMTAVDTPLRWWLTDPRQLKVVEHRDWLHVRILDVVAALTARTCAAPGELVLEVTDPFRPGPATEGLFRLTAAADGSATCEPATDAEPDLSLDIAALGSLYLGGVPAHDLAAARLVTELIPGAVVRTDALFASPVAPFCVTHF